MNVKKQRLIAFLCFASAAAYASAQSSASWLQPVLFRFFGEQGIDEASTGFLLSAEVGAIAASAALIARFAKREQAQLLAIGGIIIAAMASFITLYVDSYNGYLSTRVIVGFGVGLTIMIGNIVAANSDDPDKFFARIGCVNLLFGSFMLGGLHPIINQMFEQATPYTTAFVSILIFIPFMLLLPKISVFDKAAENNAFQPEGKVSKKMDKNTWLLVISIFIIALCSGIVWTLYALIGEASGLSPKVVDQAISMSILAGFAGMVLPAIFGGVFGRVIPFTLALIALTGAIWVLTSTPSALAFQIAIGVNVAAIYFIMPYMYGAAVEIDGGANAAAYIGSSFLLANAVSPFIGGILISTVGIEAIGILVIIAAIISAVLFIIVDKNLAKRSNHEDELDTHAISESYQ